MFGMTVYVDSHICDMKFVRWVKSHRKSRINRKWHRKYGAVICCAGVAYQINGMGLVVCPCFKNEMDKAVAEGPDPFEAMLTAPIPHPLLFSTF